MFLSTFPWYSNRRLSSQFCTKKLSTENCWLYREQSVFEYCLFHRQERTRQALTQISHIVNIYFNQTNQISEMATEFFNLPHVPLNLSLCQTEGWLIKALWTLLMKMFSVQVLFVLLETSPSFLTRWYVFMEAWIAVQLSGTEKPPGGFEDSVSGKSIIYQWITDGYLETVMNNRRAAMWICGLKRDRLGT